MTPIGRGVLWLLFLAGAIASGQDHVLAAWQRPALLAATIALAILVVLRLSAPRQTCAVPGHDHAEVRPSLRAFFAHAVPLLVLGLALAGGGDGLGSHALHRAGGVSASAATAAWLEDFAPQLSTSSRGSALPATLDAPALVGAPLALEVTDLYRRAHADADVVSVIGRFEAFADPGKVPVAQLPPTADPDEARGLLYRFVIVCCAADSRPIMAALIGAQPLSRPDGAWIRITGRWIRAEGGLAAIRVERCEDVDEPADPYLTLRWK